MGITRYHLLIGGRVQGVGYRMSAQIAAEKLGLWGWVRNLSNGQVEIVAEGQIEQLKQLLDWAWQGPRFAEVTDISVTEQSATGEFDNFKIR
ncbi:MULTISPECIES: acylphosphatase [unclassified Methylophaga]|jgi:acylphosphatase|uniref:acylphosphatase n=2 Tax=Methylophaga TaxID=40222 RepID=UPI000C8D01F5|nr:MULTISPECIES: acylphosphatase [unclassified Methylophaga]MAK68024.1 acylphosphatase [Methylophaga sp.]MAY16799.1 acylphosphatase [Methylophaga sp.]HAO25326.1 acylphosphatase [Methylophaga sp.]|tara:strand:- start:17734 stop:18009 length:276 start_codon:yes stop_codon:yes gene_type:complete